MFWHWLSPWDGLLNWHLRTYQSSTSTTTYLKSPTMVIDVITKLSLPASSPLAHQWNCLNLVPQNFSPMIWCSDLYQVPIRKRFLSSQVSSLAFLFQESSGSEKLIMIHWESVRSVMFVGARVELGEKTWANYVSALLGPPSIPRSFGIFPYNFDEDTLVRLSNPVFIFSQGWDIFHQLGRKRFLGATLAWSNGCRILMRQNLILSKRRLAHGDQKERLKGNIAKGSTAEDLSLAPQFLWRPCRISRRLSTQWKRDVVRVLR